LVEKVVNRDLGVVDRDVELRCVGVGREALPDLNLATRAHTTLARWLVVLVRAPVHSDADNGVAVSAEVGFGKVQESRGRSEYNMSSINQMLHPVHRAMVVHVSCPLAGRASNSTGLFTTRVGAVCLDQQAVHGCGANCARK
jgi:hypothetical protein